MTQLDPLRAGLFRRTSHLEQEIPAQPSLGRIVRIRPPDGPLPTVGLLEADRVNAALRSRYDINLMTTDADGALMPFPGGVVENLAVAYPPGFLNIFGRLDIDSTLAKYPGSNTHGHAGVHGPTSANPAEPHYHTTEVVLSPRDPSDPMAQVVASFVLLPEVGDDVLISTFKAGRGSAYYISGFLTAHVAFAGGSTFDITP